MSLKPPPRPRRQALPLPGQTSHLPPGAILPNRLPNLNPLAGADTRLLSAPPHDAYRTVHCGLGPQVTPVITLTPTTAEREARARRGKGRVRVPQWLPGDMGTVEEEGEESGDGQQGRRGDAKADEKNEHDVKTNERGPRGQEPKGIRTRAKPRYEIGDDDGGEVHHEKKATNDQAEHKRREPTQTVAASKLQEQQPIISEHHWLHPKSALMPRPHRAPQLKPTKPASQTATTQTATPTRKRQDLGLGHPSGPPSGHPSVPPSAPSGPPSGPPRPLSPAELSPRYSSLQAERDGHLPYTTVSRLAFASTSTLDLSSILASAPSALGPGSTARAYATISHREPTTTTNNDKDNKRRMSSLRTLARRRPGLQDIFPTGSSRSGSGSASASASGEVRFPLTAKEWNKDTARLLRGAGPEEGGRVRGIVKRVSGIFKK